MTTIESTTCEYPNHRWTEPMPRWLQCVSCGQQAREDYDHEGDDIVVYVTPGEWLEEAKFVGYDPLLPVA